VGRLVSARGRRVVGRVAFADDDGLASGRGGHAEHPLPVRATEDRFIDERARSAEARDEAGDRVRAVAEVVRERGADGDHVARVVGGRGDVVNLVPLAAAEVG
jgi:hypothetical protein